MGVQTSLVQCWHYTLVYSPLHFHLVSFLSSVTSGMEEIVMHERYQDMQTIISKHTVQTQTSNNLLGQT